jgi:hypothetical protein
VPAAAIAFTRTSRHLSFRSLESITDPLQPQTTLHQRRSRAIISREPQAPELHAAELSPNALPCPTMSAFYRIASAAHFSEAQRCH